MASQVFIKHQKKTFFTLLTLFLFVGLLAIYASCQSETQGYKNHPESVAYVGMAKCQECHDSKHATFVHTGMGQSFDLASKSKSSATFGPEHLVYDSFNNMNYLPFWKGERLFIREFRLNGNDTVHLLEQEIDYIVGSGQHTNSHLYNENGFVFQAPLTFYVQEQKWDLPPGFENGNNSRFSRVLDVECMSCHNSMPEVEEGSPFKFLSVGRGIDCERCHGPGEVHVAEREAGKGVDVSKEIDYSIVNPRKLDYERQIDVCQRCHLQGLNVLKKGKSFTDFKPGMVLSDVFEIYLPKFEGGSGQFDMANHADRLQRSKCFIESNKGKLDFTCISCHNPHVSVKSTGSGVYNATCAACHTNNTCTAPKEALAAADNNCVSCHMPQKGAVDIPHVSVHDHFIQKPSRVMSEEEGRLIGLYAVNNSDPDPYYLTKAYLEYWEKFDKNPFFLKKAKEMLDRQGYEDLWLKYYYLTEDYQSAAKSELVEEEAGAWDLFMLGIAKEKSGAKNEGIYYLEQASNKDPYNPAINIELLAVYVRNQEVDKALGLGEELCAAFPKNADALKYTAKALVMHGDVKEGISKAEQAFALAPDDIVVWEVLLNGFMRKQDEARVQYWAEKIVQQDPSHAAKQVLN